MKVWSGGGFTEIFFFAKIIVLGTKHLKLVPRIMVHGCLVSCAAYFSSACEK